MQAVSAEPRVPEPSPEGLKRSPLNTGVLEEFAQTMAENIIQSFISQMETVGPEVDCFASRFNQNQEMLAEELASALVQVAVREVCRRQAVEDHQQGSWSSAGVKMDGGQAKNLNEYDSERSTEMYPVEEVQTSKDTHPSRPSLSQSGLPVIGSLDYPDAPPTTPLLPELERSRYSFSRKLKGGLAKVYLPSPPPPTPNSHGGAIDPQVALMEHLMHSLSTDDIARDCFEAGSHHVAKMEAFAEALSRDIIDRVLSGKEQIGDDSDLQRLAQQLAETIITSSLDEAKSK